MNSKRTLIILTLTLILCLFRSGYAISEADLIGAWELMSEIKGDKKHAGNSLGTQLWTFNAEGTGKVSMMGINAFSFTWYLNGDELNLTKKVGSKSKEAELSKISISKDSFTSTRIMDQSGNKTTSITTYARDKSPTQAKLAQKKSDAPSPFGALGNILEQLSNSSAGSENNGKSSLQDMLKSEDINSGKYSCDKYEVDVPDNWGGMKIGGALMIYEGGKPKSILSPDLTKANFTLNINATNPNDKPSDGNSADLNRLKSDMQTAVSQNPLGLDVNVKSVNREQIAGQTWIKYLIETDFKSGMTLTTERYIATDNAYNAKIDIAYTFPKEKQEQFQSFITKHITTIKLK